MVTWTAITLARWDDASILQRPRQRRSGNDGGQRKHIAAQDVKDGEKPLPAFHKCKALIGVTGERCIRAAKANHNQQSPARIDQHAFGREYEKESYNKTAGNVDQQRAVRKCRRKVAGDQQTEEVTGAGSDDGAERDPEIVQDGVLQQTFCRSYQPQGRLMANPIAGASVYSRVDECEYDFSLIFLFEILASLSTCKPQCQPLAAASYP